MQQTLGSNALEFLQTLKVSTSVLHQQLESLPLSAALMAPHVTKSDYGRYLTVMHPVIRFCEDNVFPIAAPYISELKERGKLDKIALDIKNLNISDLSLPAFGMFTEKISEAEALGFLYVIEGSTLGGNVILKHLSKSSIPDLVNSSNYFSIYGGDLGKMWKQFLFEFTTYAFETKSQDQIISAAKKTFQAIHDHFQVLAIK